MTIKELIRWKYGSLAAAELYFGLYRKAGGVEDFKDWLINN